MKRHHYIAGLLILSGWIGCSPVVAESADDDARRLEQLKGEISQLSSKLELDKTARKALVDELARTEKEIGRLGNAVHRLQKSIDQLDRELGKLAIRKSRQQAELELHRNKLRALVVSAYSTGRQERLKLFLNQQDPVLMNRILTYYDYFNRDRIRHIELGNKLIAQIRQTEQGIQDKKQQLDGSYRQKSLQLEAVRQAKASRSELVAKLDADIRGKSQSLNQLKENAAVLKNLLEEIQRQKKLKQQQRKIKFASMKGRLPWPASGYLKKLFGEPKAGGINWDGVFITAPEGREVRAVHHGRVAYSDWLRGYGLLMIIDHGDGFMTLYGHNQSLFKETGEWVDAGEPIALVGNSGGQKKNGLYFSIRKNGKPTNPKKWCHKSRNRKL